MGTQIMDLSEYHMQDGVFFLKNQFIKRIKIAVAVFFVLGVSSIPKDITHNIQHWTDVPPSKDVAMINYVAKFNKDDAVKIVQASQRWAARFGLNVIDLLAIQKVESGFSKHAISSAGAMGIMQVMTKVHLDKIVAAKKELGNPEIFDVSTNIFIGAWIYKQCVDKTKVESSAWACYNGSLGMNTDYSDKVKAARKEIAKEVGV